MWGAAAVVLHIEGRIPLSSVCWLSGRLAQAFRLEVAPPPHTLCRRQECWRRCFCYWTTAILSCSTQYVAPSSTSPLTGGWALPETAGVTQVSHRNEQSHPSRWLYLATTARYAWTQSLARSIRILQIPDTLPDAMALSE